ncbi:aldehyde dehydrogenase family protein [bacterium]|nr:aldehyde dehydrogenase family protein [bacterium]
MQKYNMIISGHRDEGGSYLKVIDPYRLEPFAEVPRATLRDLERALAGAEKAFQQTRKLSPLARYEVLFRIVDILKKRSEEFSRILVREVGKTIKEARAEVFRAIDTFALSGDAVLSSVGKVIPFEAASNGQYKWGFYERFPLGPVAAIIPFNFPLNLAAHKIGPAIAVGNPIIIKPSPKAPLSTFLLGEVILESGYPPEAVSVLFGEGGEIARPLVGDPRVKVVTFTGSAAVGKSLLQIAGLKSTVMELGSNSGVLVMPDTDLERAAVRVVQGAFALAGQVCISVQRVFVHSRIYEQFVELVVQKCRALKTGDPALLETDMGPMISEESAVKLEGIIAHSGKILCGGEKQRTLFQPTIVLEPDNSSPLLCEEAFGPVFALVKISSFEEGLKRLNDSPYGLQAGIFTRDIHLARKAFEELEVGGVMINEIPTFRADLMPYGGVKNSGIGREGPEFAIEHMTFLKTFGVHRVD